MHGSWLLPCAVQIYKLGHLSVAFMHLWWQLAA